jgi:hypothetical protein
MMSSENLFYLLWVDDTRSKIIAFYVNFYKLDYKHPDISVRTSDRQYIFRNKELTNVELQGLYPIPNFADSDVI